MERCQNPGSRPGPGGRGTEGDGEVFAGRTRGWVGVLLWPRAPVGINKVRPPWVQMAKSSWGGPEFPLAFVDGDAWLVDGLDSSKTRAPTRRSGGTARDELAF